MAAECKNNRAVDRSHVADKTADDAWNAMLTADKEQDMDDFKQVSADGLCRISLS